jgi:hypothetical protein
MTVASSLLHAVVRDAIPEPICVGVDRRRVALTGRSRTSKRWGSDPLRGHLPRRLCDGRAGLKCRGNHTLHKVSVRDRARGRQGRVLYVIAYCDCACVLAIISV